MDDTNDTQDVALENNDAVIAPENTDEATAEEEVTEPSAREQELEAELAKWKRIATRKSKKSDDAPETESKSDTQSSDLDYGQKAFLRSYDIKGADEIALVKDWQKRTGDELDALVEDDIFQARLGKLREARAAAAAVPKGTRRSATVATDDVSMWQAKIAAGQATLADIEDVSVRRKVLNARVEHERVGSRFSDTPIQMT